MSILNSNQLFPNNEIIIDFVSLKDKMHKGGRQKRFFKVLCYNTESNLLDDITYRVYNLVKNENIFTFKDDCFIEIGCGMDMAFNLSDKLSKFLNTKEGYFYCIPCARQKEKDLWKQNVTNRVKYFLEDLKTK